MGAPGLIGVVTLSPAVDVTYHLASAHLGEVNRVETVTKAPGGKGLNVARVLKKLGSSAVLHAPLGGASGLWIKDQLATLEVELIATNIAAETRSAVAIVAQETSVFNEPASAITETELVDLESTLASYEFVVVTGSVPTSVSVERFGKLLESIKQKSKLLLVDTTGDYLIAASKHADYLKPNLEELLAATGLPREQAIAKLQEHGARVILSLGDQGALLHSDKRLGFRAPSQQGNPTGAGDALTAGFVSVLAGNEHASELDAFRFGCALSAASVRSPIAGDFSEQALTELLTEIEEA